MLREWVPSTWGRLFTGSQKWRLRLVDESVELVVDGKVHQAPISSPSPLRVHRGLFWTDLTLHPSESHAVRVDGLPNVRTQELEDALSTVLAEQRRRKSQQTFNEAYAQIRAWLVKASQHLRRAQDERRWITHEQQQAVLCGRPSLSLSEDALWELFRDPGVQAGLPESAERIEKGLLAWQADWQAACAQANERHVRQELVACKDLFDRVESRPLTEEQARAVICFDNRVQVVASAGSGKTSTMVAKAAYAIHRGFARPERIVLLAFNKKAAEELQERAARSFDRLEVAGVVVEACTFHALGRRITGKARGRMPEVP